LLFSDGYGVSVGASGAIYGLLGAMLLLTKKRGAAYTGMNYSTMLLLAFTAICFGFLEEGVDNFAHIGGFLGGILCFGLFMRKK
ncbi:MAG: rhomboid family intramembrane serine protease, partial [Anaerotignum sp.]|nr:rhomboid family intramembrane serine protease [Anaerotignum sp.]